MFIYRFFSTAGFRYSLFVFLLSWLSVVTAAESQKKPIDIKAGLLSSSLNQLASQTEISIVVNTDLVKNKSAKAIKGFYTPQNALCIPPRVIYLEYVEGGHCASRHEWFPFEWSLCYLPRVIRMNYVRDSHYASRHE